MVIRCVATGELVTYRSAYETDADYAPTDYIYTEGNYACDCNRELFFRLGKGLEAEPCAYPCSSGRYVLVSVHENGHLIVQDDRGA